MDRSFNGTRSELASPNHRPQTDQEREHLRPVSVPSRRRSLRTSRSRKPDGVVVGTVVGLVNTGTPLVNFPNNASGEPLLARSTVSLCKDQVGRSVALMFEEGDPQKPIVMGILQSTVETSAGTAGIPHKQQENPIVVEVDGKRFVFTAENEIVLRCGEASITLTRAGKVLIQGAYVLTRSSGANRIKGAVVEIN